VEEGGQVSKDRLIASIEPTSYSIAKELADIQVNQVQDEYDRLKSMHDNKSLSESDFAKITYGLLQAKAQQKLHTKNFADTRLYSPIDGILLKKLAEVGEITGVGIPVLVVSDIRKIKISAYIPENELHNVKIGQKAIVNVSSVNKAFEAKITEVGSLADPSSRSFLLKIEADNPDLLMRPGMIADVTVAVDETDRILVVPAGAVTHDFSNQSFVYVADTLKNKAFRRFVITGKLLNDMIEITSGLNEGEPVVTGGYQMLFDGSEIVINK
jgi:RND family efflux transporter MFP subunit